MLEIGKKTQKFSQRSGNLFESHIFLINSKNLKLFSRFIRIILTSNLILEYC